jgi:hypothetical protein
MMRAIWFTLLLNLGKVLFCSTFSAAMGSKYDSGCRSPYYDLKGGGLAGNSR